MNIKYVLLVAYFMALGLVISLVGTEMTDILKRGIPPATIIFMLVGAASALSFIFSHKLVSHRMWISYGRKFHVQSEFVDTERLCQKVVVRRTVPEAILVCRESLAALPGSVILDEDVVAGHLRFKTPSSLVHFYGDLIDFRFEAIAHNFTEIDICCSPATNLTLLGYGRTLKLLDALCSFLIHRVDHLQFGEIAALGIARAHKPLS
jgi:hypothetical protein